MKIKVTDGNVRYLMRSGNDMVMGKTSPENVEWMLKNNKYKIEPPKGYGLFGLHVSDYYFEIEPEENELGEIEPKSSPKSSSESSPKSRALLKYM